MLNNFSSKCIKMAKRCAFGTSYGIIYFNSGIKESWEGVYQFMPCFRFCHINSWTRPTVAGRSIRKNGPQEHQFQRG